MPQGIAKDLTKRVVAKELSLNAKLGPVSATYVSQASCPTSCPFYHSGCYAETGTVGLITTRLNAASGAATPEDVATEEAQAIWRLSGHQALRLHVVGDCSTPEAARIVSTAADEYSRRYGKPAWTYTHAWANVARADWGSVSVLASCESPEQVQEAQDLGYATAMVVPVFPRGPKAWKEGEQTYIPCPQQTHDDITCASCQLCWRGDKLRARKATIAFAAHGTKRREVINLVSAIAR